MEPTTTFDLNHAIQQWRRRLAGSPAIQGESLDELESHLRDSVINLQSRNLSDEEAFLVATKRVGSHTLLEREFGKANSQAIWLDRFLWALIFLQGWNAIDGLVTGLSYVYVQGYASHMTDITNWFLFIMQAGIPVLSAFVSVTLCLWLGRSSQTHVREILENLSQKPFHLVVVMSVLTLVMEEIIPVYHYASYAAANNSRFFSWTLNFWNFARPVLINFFIASLVFMLARKRMARIA